jgi:hypothetical protein
MFLCLLLGTSAPLAVAISLVAISLWLFEYDQQLHQQPVCDRQSTPRFDRLADMLLLE